MKRVIVALAAVALLAMAGTAAVAFAAPMLTGQVPQSPGQQQTTTCGGATGNTGSYNPASSPTVKSLAGKLGISADDLVGELKSGKSVADVSKEKNVDEQSLIDTLMAPRKDMMAIAVKYGYLTQDQANQALQNMSQAAKNQIESKGLTGSFGGMMGGGFGGMMGGQTGAGMMGGGTGATTGTSFGGGMMGGFGHNVKSN